jgi:transposase
MKATTAPNRQQIRREASYRALLDSALRLFQERGYAATTVIDIVEPTPYSPGAFYYHFANKTDCFWHVVDYRDQLRGEWWTIAGRMSPANATLTDVIAKTLGRLGESLRGHTAWTMVVVDFYHQDRDDPETQTRLAELADELFGARLSTGSVDAICQHASTALSVSYSALRDWILAQDAVHVDETGWRTAGDARALWTAATQGASIFEIAEHCNREQFNELIGDYAGIVVSDRWNGYAHLDPDRRQVCWSHIQRDFRRHSEGLAEQKTFGEQGLELTRGAFASWRAYQHEHHDRSRLNAEIAPIQTQLRRLLEDASPKSQRTRWHRRFANNLLKIWPALWTFATIAGVEPTNNPAERALRSPVIHRKLSHGTRTDNGERFAERALTAAATCRQQRRSLYDFLTQLLTAHARGDPLPALT